MLIEKAERRHFIRDSSAREDGCHGIANGHLEVPWWELVFRTTAKID
jgi:hypothetical protein